MKRTHSEKAMLGLGRLVIGFGRSNRLDRSEPSTSTGGGSPASDASVGYRSSDSTRKFETSPPCLDGSRRMKGTRVPSSKLLCFPQILCSLHGIRVVARETAHTQRACFGVNLSRAWFLNYQLYIMQTETEASKV